MNKLFSKGNYIKRLLKKKDIKAASLIDRSDEKYVGFGKNTMSELLKKEDFTTPIDIDRVKTILSVINADPVDYEYLLPKQGLSNARIIGEPVDSDNLITPIGGGYYALTARFVPVKARAGYMVGYADPEFLETLPKYTTTVDKLVTGNYSYFEAEGDSMNNGDIETAIIDGMVLLGRNIAPHLWSSKLHTHKWSSFIFMHKTEGVVIKQVVGQNLENGDITLRSLNPDKEKYPDFTINLDEIKEIYNVIKRIM